MFAPVLAVVFAGIVNTDGGSLDKQIRVVAHDMHLQPATLPAAQLRTLTHHGEGTRDIVAQLHVDGLVAFEIVPGARNPTLRVVIYGGDGGLKSLSDMPLGGRTMTKDALEALRSNVEDDVKRLQHTPAAEPDEIEMDTPPPPPAPKLPLIAAKPARKAAIAPVAALAITKPVEVDASKPFGEEPPATHVAAKVETADDSVSAEDIEAMTGGGAPEPAADLHAAIASVPALRLQAALGIGLASRSFTGPSTIAGYSSSPVGALLLEANVQPTARVAIGVTGETTLGMTSPTQTGFATTTIARWEATTSYTVVRGVVDVAPLVGLGRRSFAIDSNDASRTPDSDYNYLILGAAASSALGSHFLVRGLVAFEPVVSGTDPMEMTFGSASRWALDLGAAVEARPHAHVFVRAAVNYQRFTWSWDSAGSRGAGGAVDGYPSGTLSLGAEY